jgi:hypothetical protein
MNTIHTSERQLVGKLLAGQGVVERVPASLGTCRAPVMP